MRFEQGTWQAIKKDQLMVAPDFSFCIYFSRLLCLAEDVGIFY